MPCDNRGRDQSGKTASQGTPRTSGCHRELGRDKEGSYPVSEGKWPCWHLDLGLLASRTVREWTSLVQVIQLQYFLMAALGNECSNSPLQSCYYLYNVLWCHLPYSSVICVFSFIFNDQSDLKFVDFIDFPYCVSVSYFTDFHSNVYYFLCSATMCLVYYFFFYFLNVKSEITDFRTFFSFTLLD